MSRISILQLKHLIRARVAFYTHGNKKSVFLPDFSYFEIIKKGYKTNAVWYLYAPVFLVRNG